MSCTSVFSSEGSETSINFRKNSFRGEGMESLNKMEQSGESGYQDFRVENLAIDHFLRHVKNQLAIDVFGLTQQAAKLIEIMGVLAGTAPSVVVGRPSL